MTQRDPFAGNLSLAGIVYFHTQFKTSETLSASRMQGKVEILYSNAT